ncbi:flagellar hook-length control protein FliK [Rubinisphaera sp. JC750]|uniref:flagellar hook-length control protein FliK n=1 Tax=Rubinisphaera sp. JC750 TaxID=2898658 RepID=UPI001F413198|nr:flagellar hook-length control protein FliK [Rubinisphaera sp. JC750]
MPQDLISYLSLNTWADPRTSGQATPSLQPGVSQERTQFADQLKRRSEPAEPSANRSTERTASPRRDSAATPAADTTRPSRPENNSVAQRTPTESEAPRRSAATAADSSESKASTPQLEQRPAAEPAVNSAEPVETGEGQETTETSAEFEAAVVSNQPQGVPQKSPEPTAEGETEGTTNEAVPVLASSQQATPATPSALSRHWSARQAAVENKDTRSTTTAAETEEATLSGPVAPAAFSRSLNRGLAPDEQARKSSESTESAEVNSGEETETTAVNSDQTVGKPADTQAWAVEWAKGRNSSDGEQSSEDVSSEQTEGDGNSAPQPPVILQAAGGQPIAGVGVHTDQETAGESPETPAANQTTELQRATIPLATAQQESQRPAVQDNARQESQPRREPFAAPLEATTRATGEKSVKSTTPPTLDANKPGFAEKLSSYMQSAAESGKSLRIRLNPKELGVLQIEVQRVDGQTTARLEVETPAARSIVMEQLHMLRDSLQSQGIRLDQLEVELNEHLSEQSEGEQRFSDGGGEGNGGEESKQQHEDNDHGSGPALVNPSNDTRNPTARWNTEEIDVAV